MDSAVGRDSAPTIQTPGELVEAALNAREIETQEDVGMDVFVARQPIFWADQNAMGYELLYRSNGDVQVAGDEPLETMSSAVLVNALLAMGLKDITDGKVAFLNFPRELLLDEMAQLLDPKEVVIELHETIRPDPEVLSACKSLVEQGFVLALDDFEFEAEFAPLLEMAQIVKVDVLGKSPEELGEVVRKLTPFKVQLLAEKVESEEIHQACMDLGFALFQGFHYLRPETLSKRDLSTESVAVVHLMNLLGDMNVTDRKVEEAFRSDPGLSYKLLRMVNSAALGGRGVTSIEHALRLLGREHLYRWISMLLVAEGGDGTGVRHELVKSSLFRGRLCELLGDQIRGPSVRGVPVAGTLFLIGLFSRIDVLLKIRMEDLFKKVDLSEVAQEALLWRSGVGGQLLKAVEAYEDAKWEDAEAEVADMGMDPGDLPNLYLESIAWTGDRLAGAGGLGLGDRGGKPPRSRTRREGPVRGAPQSKAPEEFSPGASFPLQPGHTFKVPGASPPHPRPSSLEDVSDLLQVERFLDVGPARSLDEILCRPLLEPTGHEHGPLPHLGSHRIQLLKELDSRGPGHVDVHHHMVEASIPQDLQCHASVHRFSDFVALSLQVLPQDRPYHLVVIHDKDFQGPVPGPVHLHRRGQRRRRFPNPLVDDPGNREHDGVARPELRAHLHMEASASGSDQIPGQVDPAVRKLPSLLQLPKGLQGEGLEGRSVFDPLSVVGDGTPYAPILLPGAQSDGPAPWKEGSPGSSQDCPKGRFQVAPSPSHSREVPSEERKHADPVIPELRLEAMKEAPKEPREVDGLLFVSLLLRGQRPLRQVQGVGAIPFIISSRPGALLELAHPHRQLQEDAVLRRIPLRWPSNENRLPGCGGFPERPQGRRRQGEWDLSVSGRDLPYPPVHVARARHLHPRQDRSSGEGFHRLARDLPSPP